jgi:hypothetical protein
MSAALTLFPEELSSLMRMGTGPVLSGAIPTAHLLKLVGLRYIEAENGYYRATASGRLRIASGR